MWLCDKFWHWIIFAEQNLSFNVPLILEKMYLGRNFTTFRHSYQVLGSSFASFKTVLTSFLKTCHQLMLNLFWDDCHWCLRLNQEKDWWHLHANALISFCWSCIWKQLVANFLNEVDYSLKSIAFKLSYSFCEYLPKNHYHSN